MPGLLVDQYDHVTVFTLNRPEKRNSFDTAMSREITQRMHDFNADPEQYVAIFTGSGDKAFCSGGDLKEASARNLTPGSTPTVGVAEIDLFGVRASPKPTIAAVNGLAVAGGFELSLVCDIRIAADTASFGVFEVKRGFMPGIAVNVLARQMPLGDALYMLMTADFLSAQDAYRLGLVQKLTSSGALLEEALKVATMIAGNSQVAVQASKRVACLWRDHAIRESLEFYKSVNERLMLCDDVREGTRAFVEKREPKFSNEWPRST